MIMKSKYLKHFLSMMTLPFIAATGMPTDIKKKAVKRPELKFGADGKFRILHITDIHEVDPEMDDDEDRAIPRDKCVEALNVIEKSIERTNPDLVVFGGDNINGYWEEFDYEYIRKTIEKITEPVRRRNLPLAIVFGNHDSEIMSNFREFQMMLYLQYENFLGCFNAEEMYGCGNYNVKIKSSDGKKDAYNLWFVDSNDYPYDENGKRLEGYDMVHKDQLDWYEKAEEKIKKENGGKTLPAILFQHIPVVQELDALIDVDKDDPEAFFMPREGRYVKLSPEYYISGELAETPRTPGEKGREQFELWKKHGDIRAAFFGHDHKNDFVIEMDGIKLVQTFSVGYHTYGDKRGGRLIILDENEPDNIYTESFTVERITDTDFGR